MSTNDKKQKPKCTAKSTDISKCLSDLDAFLCQFNNNEIVDITAMSLTHLDSVVFDVETQKYERVYKINDTYIREYNLHNEYQRKDNMRKLARDMDKVITANKSNETELIKIKEKSLKLVELLAEKHYQGIAKLFLETLASHRLINNTDKFFLSQIMQRIVAGYAYREVVTGQDYRGKVIATLIWLKEEYAGCRFDDYELVDLVSYYNDMDIKKANEVYFNKFKNVATALTPKNPIKPNDLYEIEIVC